MVHSCLERNVPVNSINKIKKLQNLTSKYNNIDFGFFRYKYKLITKKGKRKVQGVPQSQTVALPRPQEEEETDKSKQAQTEQTYEKH